MHRDSKGQDARAGFGAYSTARAAHDRARALAAAGVVPDDDGRAILPEYTGPVAWVHFGGTGSTEPHGPCATAQVPARQRPLSHHIAGRTYTRTGYGKRIPSVWQVHVNGRWRRVYTICYRNSGRCFLFSYVGPARGPWLCTVSYIG